MKDSNDMVSSVETEYTFTTCSTAAGALTAKSPEITVNYGGDTNIKPILATSGGVFSVATGYCPDVKCVIVDSFTGIVGSFTFSIKTTGETIDYNLSDLQK